MENDSDYKKERDKYYDKQRMRDEQRISRGHEYLGWISLFLVFTIKGLPLAIAIAIYALVSKNHNSTVPIVTLIFSSAIVIIYLLAILL